MNQHYKLTKEQKERLNKARQIIDGITDFINWDEPRFDQQDRDEAAVYLAQEIALAVEKIKNDLEIVNEQVAESMEVGILGSKKKGEYIDTQEKLDAYFDEILTNQQER